MTNKPGYCSPGTVKKVRNGKHSGKFRWRFTYLVRENGALITKHVDKLAGTLAEARHDMAALKKLIEATHGGGPKGGKKSLHGLVDEWLEDRKPHLTAKTYQNYRNMSNRVKRTWVNVALEDVDYDFLKGAHVHKGRSAHLALAMLKQVLDYACKPSRRWLPYNPATELTPLPYTRKARRAMQPSYFLRLLKDGAADPGQRMTFFLQMVLGGRISEVLALQRIDFARATGKLRIARQLAGPNDPDADDDGTVQRLKSGSGMRYGLFENIPARIVKLGPGAAAILGAYLDYLDASGYTGPWLFPAPGGGTWDYSNWLKKVWRKAWVRVNAAGREEAKKTGVPFKIERYVPHEMRHSHISFRILLGDDPVSIGADVGQGHINITLKYAHVVQDIEEIEPALLRMFLGRIPWAGDEIGDLALSA